jgi:porin
VRTLRIRPGSGKTGSEIFGHLVGLSALRACVALAIFSFGTISANAQQSGAQTQSSASASQNTSPGEQSFANLFSTSRSNLLGDIAGLRTMLAKYGISFGLQDTNEVFGNATGGIKRGANYDALTLMGLGVDTKKAVGLAGGAFNVSAFQIRGRDLNNNLEDLQIYSGIEALPSTRLWELWYQQTFLGGKMDVKVGQQSID